MEISKYVRLIGKSPKKTFRSLWGAQYRQSASQAVIQINDDIWDARNCRDFFIVVQRLLYSVYTWLSPVEEDGQYWIQVGGGGCSGAQGLGDPVGRQVGPPTEPDQDGDTIVKYKLYSQKLLLTSSSLKYIFQKCWDLCGLYSRLFKQN